MLETEMNNHLGYAKYARDDEPNYCNGTKPKTVRSKYGEAEKRISKPFSSYEGSLSGNIWSYQEVDNAH